MEEKQGLQDWCGWLYPRPPPWIIGAVVVKSRRAEQRGSRRARRERSAHGGAAEESSAIPPQPQPEPEHTADSPKTGKEVRRDEPAWADPDQRLRASPPGARTQIGSCVIFYFGGRGGRGHCAFSPCRNRVRICVRQTTLSASSSGAAR